MVAHFLVVALVIWMAAVPAWGQPSSAVLPVEELLAGALVDHPELRAARLEVEAAEADARSRWPEGAQPRQQRHDRSDGAARPQRPQGGSRRSRGSGGCRASGAVGREGAAAACRHPREGG